MFLFQQDFFERTADRQPGDTAVDDHGDLVSYGRLEEQANRLAHVLRSVGCGPNERICIFTAKSARMYAAMLGTLKAGGCWVPLTVAFPIERLTYLIETLSPVAVVVDETTLELASHACAMAHSRAMVVLLGKAPPRPAMPVIDDEAISVKPSDRPTRTHLTGEDLAYVIFTSGSTGTPKGVMVRHRSTVHFLSLCPSFFDIVRGSRFAHFSDITFDPSIFDIFHCWSSGGVVVPANRRTYRIDPARFIAEQRIQVMFVVPTALTSIRDVGRAGRSNLASMRHLLLTGEPVPAHLVRDWYLACPDLTIYNMYGTTETSIVSHWCRIPRSLGVNDAVPLGRPLPGFRILLIDGDRVVGPGEVGEALVSGTQLAAGYWSNPFQTERFFVPEASQAGLTTAYRTGDLLREGPDGQYYFVSRTDSQVKLRGHRVEIGEVENVLLADDRVVEAAVVVAERPGTGRCLVGFVRANGPTGRELRHALSRCLPTYMVPERVVVVPGMPTGQNGKIDRQALSVMAIEVLHSSEPVDHDS